MFANKTFENILSDMLSYVSGKNPELDTQVGSIIYTALAPIALELETAYRDMDAILEETFLETASKNYLVKHGAQFGVALNEATYGHFKGEFNVDVGIGSRFNSDKFNYNVIGKLSDPTDDNPYYTFELVCETSGSEPNNYLGNLTQITYVAGLNYAKLVSVITYGEDEESTEAYRYRLQLHATNPPNNGNVSQYNEWLDAYDGIGKYKVIPCPNGQINHVTLTILNSENRKAEDELISEVQEYFDPIESQGMGNGQAPIGAIVTVNTATETPIIIECDLVLNKGYSSPVGVVEAVEGYLDSIKFYSNSIGYIPISAQIYNAESVADISSLKITVKGSVMDASAESFISSVTIGDDEIAVLDTENSVWGA